jgi:NAD kinase
MLDSNSMCMTFLNIDGPYSNPIVANNMMEFEVEIVKNAGILSTDGIKVGTLHKGDSFSVKLSNRPVKVIRFKDRKESFSEKLEKIITRRMVK